MVNGIDSVYARIRSIYDRINEIQRNVGNIYSTVNINSSQKLYNNSSTQTNSNQLGSSKTFQEVLQEALMDVNQDKSENKVNIVSKPEESWKEVLINEKINQYSSKEDMFDKIIDEASSKFGLPKELIKAVIKAESNFNPIAISPKNAMGLMQLIPSTAKEVGVEDIFDPYQNIMGGTKYLKMLLDKYNGNLFLALSAYNAGPNRVDNSGGIPDIEETQNYVDKVIEFYKKYSSK